jgi:hypothetical protein
MLETAHKASVPPSSKLPSGSVYIRQAIGAVIIIEKTRTFPYTIITKLMVEKMPSHRSFFLPESYTRYRSEAHKALCLKRSWSDFDPQAYYRYGEDQNHDTSFKGKAIQAVVDSWCKIQVLILSQPF